MCVRVCVCVSVCGVMCGVSLCSIFIDAYTLSLILFQQPFKLHAIYTCAMKCTLMCTCSSCPTADKCPSQSHHVIESKCSQRKKDNSNLDQMKQQGSRYSEFIIYIQFRETKLDIDYECHRLCYSEFHCLYNCVAPST